MRRLFPLVAAILVLETSFFAAVAPVLPEYSEEHDLSKAAAGLLLGAYPAGTFVAAIPLGWLAARWGVRPVLLGSLATLAVASVVFALADHIIVLDAARFLQGVCGAGLWAAGMAWLVTVSSVDRRGEVIGFALSAGIAGVLLGPALGGVASALGPEITFSVVGLIAAALLPWASSVPAPPADYQAGASEVRAALRRPAVLAGFWVFMLPAIFAGVIEVLEPLRLAELNADGMVIAIIFIVAAATEATLSPLAGRLSDRRGRLAPLRIGLAVSVAAAVVLPTAGATIAVGVFVTFAFVGLGTCWAPGMAMLADACIAARLPLAIAFSISNLAWAAGHFAGSAIGAPLADASSDAVPYALAGSACLITLVGTVVLARRPEPATS